MLLLDFPGARTLFYITNEITRCVEGNYYLREREREREQENEQLREREPPLLLANVIIF